MNLNSYAKEIMAPHEFVEIRLVCKADYLDPQLKIKLHEIKDKLREILHTGKSDRLTCHSYSSNFVQDDDDSL